MIPQHVSGFFCKKHNSNHKKICPQTSLTSQNKQDFQDNVVLNRWNSKLTRIEKALFHHGGFLRAVHHKVLKTQRTFIC
jgi:hypothetical protein